MAHTLLYYFGIESIQKWDRWKRGRNAKMETVDEAVAVIMAIVLTLGLFILLGR